MRERRAKLAANPEAVTKVLDFGNLKARAGAGKTLAEVREIMGMVNWRSDYPLTVRSL